MSNTHYHYIDNQAKHTWIVISGWAFLGSFVIKPIKQSNVLLVSDYNPYVLISDMDYWFKEYAIQDYSVMGFSLGALWVSRYLTHFKRAKRVVFSGVRSFYTLSQVEGLKMGLESGDESVLVSFWQDCMISVPTHDGVIKSHRDFSWQFDRLLRGLAYLTEFDFLWPVPTKKVLFFHGQLDRIAPLKEIVRQHDYDFRVIKRQGHMCCPVLDGLVG